MQELTHTEYYAGQALTGLLANSDLVPGSDIARKKIVKLAWEIAEEMNETALKKQGFVRVSRSS